MDGRRTARAVDQTGVYVVGVTADLRAFYIAGSKNGNTLGLSGLGDNDAFVMKMAPKPLDKEDDKVEGAPARE